MLGDGLIEFSSLYLYISERDLRGMRGGRVWCVPKPILQVLPTDEAQKLSCCSGWDGCSDGARAEGTHNEPRLPTVRLVARIVRRKCITAKRTERDGHSVCSTVNHTIASLGVEDMAFLRNGKSPTRNSEIRKYPSLSGSPFPSVSDTTKYICSR